MSKKVEVGDVVFVTIIPEVPAATNNGERPVWGVVVRHSGYWPQIKVLPVGNPLEYALRGCYPGELWDIWGEENSQMKIVPSKEIPDEVIAALAKVMLTGDLPT